MPQRVWTDLRGSRHLATIESDSLFALYGDLTDAGPEDRPSVLRLGVRPVPAHTEALVQFDLPSATDVRLEVFDVAGRSLRLLAGARFEAGQYTLAWDLRARDGVRIPAGVYFVRLRTSFGTRLSRVVTIK